MQIARDEFYREIVSMHDRALGGRLFDMDTLENLVKNMPNGPLEYPSEVAKY